MNWAVAGQQMALIYRTLSQYWTRQIAQCHSNRYDITHWFTVIDTICRTVSQ